MEASGLQEEKVMTVKIFVVSCLLGSLFAPSVAWSAQWNRGQCINAVNQKYGDRATEGGATSNKAAVRRCMMHGRRAI
jgi:hypothetical protein